MISLSGALLRALLACATAAGIAYLCTPAVRLIALRRGAIAKPVSDRWGKRIVTRFGGMAMYGAAVVGTLCWVPLTGKVAGLLVGWSLIVAVGLLDDLRPLRPYTKLLLQLAVGCVVVMSGIRIELIQWMWLSIPVSLLWFILVMNAFNLLDNMDGLAAGIGLIAAAFCAATAFLTNQTPILLIASVVVGACLGFLRYNFPPAKIFMGDSGSHLLGLGLGALALMGSWQHSTQLISIIGIPMLVLAVPIFDTCFVTLQRILHRRHPFRGGTDHLSHRLAILGLSPRQTVLAFYGVGIGFGLLSLATLGLKPLQAMVMWALALTGLVLLGAFLAKVNVYEVRREPLVDAPEESVRRATVIETMFVHKRRVLEVGIDFTLICTAYAAAHLLRFEGVLDVKTQRLFVQSLPIVISVKLLCFMGFGLYRGVWRYIGLQDLVAVFKAVTMGSLCSAMALLYLWRFQGFSRTMLVIDWALLFLTVSGSRIAERLFTEWVTSLVGGAVRVLIIGAGDTGDLALRQLKHDTHGRWRAVGFLDDDPNKSGSRIHGVPVLGTRQTLAATLERLGVGEVVIAMREPPLELVRQVEQECERLGVRWRLSRALAPETP